MFKPWPILDPILSIGFTIFILFNVNRNLKETLLLFLQATPDDEQMQEVHKVLTSKPEIDTLHLVLNREMTIVKIKELKRDLQEALSPFEFVHTTIELEFADGNAAMTARMDSLMSLMSMQF